MGRAGEDGPYNRVAYKGVRVENVGVDTYKTLLRLNGNKAVLWPCGFGVHYYLKKPSAAPMEQQFGFHLPDKMSKWCAGMRGTQNLVENAGAGAEGLGSWRQLMAIQQSQWRTITCSTWWPSRSIWCWSRWLLSNRGQSVAMGASGSDDVPFQWG